MTDRSVEVSDITDDPELEDEPFDEDDPDQEYVDPDADVDVDVDGDGDGEYDDHAITAMASKQVEEEKEAEPVTVTSRERVDAGNQAMMEEKEDGDGGQDEGDLEDADASTSTGDNTTPIITIALTILPEGYTSIEKLPATHTIQQVKEYLSEKYKMSSRNMKLEMDGQPLTDSRLLSDYHRIAHSDDLTKSLAITLQISVEPTTSTQGHHMPDVIKVIIPTIDGEQHPSDQIVYVHIIRDNLLNTKPFLGGFRHKLTQTIFHHASTQTARRKKRVGVVKFHRETQTVATVTRSQQTNREQGTQMDRRDLYLDHSNDKIIMARPYFTAEQLERLRDEKAREIECFLRQCFAWRRVRRLREARQEKVDAEIKERQLKQERAAAHHARQIQRRMHPRSKHDFDVLLRELEAWRLHETQRIKNSGATNEVIQVQLQDLLSKEVKLLQTIDRLKITAAKQNKLHSTKTTLEKMASPKEWSSSEGDLVEVETPFTTRARELVELYNGLCLKDVPRPQRVDILLHVKYTVKEFDCELSRSIVDLIKREEDLLRRQRSDTSLQGLRLRMSNLFLQWLKTPQFNPEAANFQKVPFVPIQATRALPEEEG